MAEPNLSVLKSVTYSSLMSDGSVQSQMTEVFEPVPCTPEIGKEP